MFQRSNSLFAHLALGAMLLIGMSAGASQNVPDFDKATAADLLNLSIQHDGDDYRYFLSYIDKRIDGLADAAFAKDLRAYFHAPPKGARTPLGEIDFIVKMASIQNDVEAGKHAWADYSFVKIADYLFNHAMTDERKRLAANAPAPGAR